MQAVRAASEAGSNRCQTLPSALRHLIAGVGLAGIDRKGACEALMNVPHPFQDVAFASDANVACLGAHRGRDGGMVVLGTGSIGFTPRKGPRAPYRRIRIPNL